VSGTDDRNLAALPKGHLHLHLEAAIREWLEKEAHPCETR
jgi:hypothetical protein